VTAILGVMVEVRRIKILRETKATTAKCIRCVSRNVSSLASSALPPSSEEQAEKPCYLTRLLSFLLDEKGASLYNVIKSRSSSIPPRTKRKAKKEKTLSLDSNSFS
jgi:hypothetical protein